MMETNRSPAEANGVLAVVKTSSMQRPATVRMPAHVTVHECLRRIIDQPAANDADRRMFEGLRREMSGPHDFFAVARAGELLKVEPSTRLEEIAVPREIRTPDGLKRIPCAAVEVVQYAEVG